MKVGKKIIIAVLSKRKCPHERGTHNIESEAITEAPGDDVGGSGEDYTEGGCINKPGTHCHVEEGRTLLVMKTPRLKQFFNLNNYSILFRSFSESHWPPAYH